MRQKTYKIYIALFLLITVVGIGMSGFIIIEDFSTLDAFFMTIITISTVGFREIHPLSQEGKIFTALLIITSFGIFAYVVTTLTKYLLDGEMRKYLKNYRVNKRIAKIQNHIIICGFGRNGRQAAVELEENKIPFIIIDKNPEIIDQLSLEHKCLYIQGDAINEEILELASIKKAKSLITTLPNDADNVFVVLTSRQLNENLKIITRASHEESNSKLIKAGANRVIMPDIIGGQQMAILVTQPNIVEFIDYILLQSKFDVNLAEVHCNNLNDCFVNQPISEIMIQNKTGANIMGVKDSNGKFVFNPDYEITLSKDIVLFSLGTPEQIKKLKVLLANG